MTGTRGDPLPCNSLSLIIALSSVSEIPNRYPGQVSKSVLFVLLVLCFEKYFLIAPPLAYSSLGVDVVLGAGGPATVDAASATVLPASSPAV